MASGIVSPVASDTKDTIFDVKRSPLGSLGRKVNFSDYDKEDDASFEHNNSTLQWETTMNSSLSDDVKLATATPDGATEPPEMDRRTSLDEGLGTLSSTNGGLQDDSQARDDDSQEDEEENLMPKVASQVFRPRVHIVSGSPARSLYSCTQGSQKSIHKKQPQLGKMYEALEMEPVDPEKQAFLSQSHSSVALYSMHPCRAGSDCTLNEEPPPRAGPRCCQNCSRSSLKAVASFIGALVIFPCFLYGAYVFLPFDVPLMPAVSARLVYTLRCGVFATFPIVLGLIIYGISRICTSSFDPFGKREKEVEIHRRYVNQSVYLFVLYFFNMAVLATYLPQEGLKLVPLLTGLFALSRLIYWLTFALGRSFRGFGYGLTFLPLVSMLLCNFYFMFIMEPQNMFAMENPGAPEAETPSPKLRLWG